MKRSGIVLPLVVAAIAAIAAPSCQDFSGTKTFGCPLEEVFTGHPADGGMAQLSVSAFMERRCGTLDCHGSIARPMRIYGKYGLRAPEEDNFSGGDETTPLELHDNYASVCGVEPEKMDQAVKDVGQSAEKLLVLLKARGVEGHKGGTIVKQGTPGDECLAGWLRGDPLSSVAPQCQAAIDKLE